MKLRIEKAIYGGAGLARIPDDELLSDETGGPMERPVAAAGKTVFVPGTIPGELVEARISQDHKTFAEAELKSILEPAATRTTPACPYYGRCGGCHYQHAAYSQQIEMKAAILRETMERAGVLKGSETSRDGNSILGILSAEAGQPWGYRNRIRLHVRAAAGGEGSALCYRQRDSHNLLAVEDCSIAAPLLVRALRGMQELAAGHELDRLCDEIEFFTNPQQDSVLVSLKATDRGPGEIRVEAPGARLEYLCAALQTLVPELKGAALWSLAQIFAPKRSGQSSPPRTTNTTAKWGEQCLIYPVGGFGYRVSLGSFFQVNRHLVDRLVHQVTAGQQGELAWDLYAGAGLFSRPLTRCFRQVRAVESAASSCADLRHNLRGTTHKIVESTTLDFLRLHVQSRKKQPVPDLVVVDPPRAGLGAEVTSLLSRIAPREIVYVSCDPTTLARDLRALLQSGYRLQGTTLVDLFPQTFHIESVSRLSLR
jgi:23S rRNA (uracil1939-C5)-methyltransferase